MAIARFQVEVCCCSTCCISCLLNRQHLTRCCALRTVACTADNLTAGVDQYACCVRVRCCNTCMTKHAANSRRVEVSRWVLSWVSTESHRALQHWRAMLAHAQQQQLSGGVFSLRAHAGCSRFAMQTPCVAIANSCSNTSNTMHRYYAWQGCSHLFTACNRRLSTEIKHMIAALRCCRNKGDSLTPHSCVGISPS
jgi:hypothetical protein